MSTNDESEKQISGVQEQHTAEIIDPGLGELDKVRNILFGRQAKSYEDRFSDLEDALNQMISDLQAKVDARLDQLEADLNEKEQRLRTALVDTDSQSAQSFSDVRNDLDNLAVAMGTDLAQAKGELRTQLNKVETKLSNDRIDREALAMMFDEVSMRLRGNNK